MTLEKGSKWQKPIAPKLNRVSFEQMDNGLFLSFDEAKILADNTDELKAYIKKLELFIDAMVEYHK